MQRYCICGTKIPPYKRLCDTCYDKYGGRKALEIPWIREHVSSMQSELNHDRRHQHLSLEDERCLQ